MTPSDPAWDLVGAYRGLIERATADPVVVGVVAFGSRAAGVFVTEDSDVDCFAIVDGPETAAHPWATNHGDPVEVWPITLEAFRGHALPGDAAEWNRPAFIRARVDLDKLGGEIGRIVDRKRRLEPDEAGTIALDALGAAINSLYRTLRNLDGSRDLEGRLDGLEVIGPILTTVFAFEERVRPFNKWLRQDLLDDPLRTIASSEVVDLVDALARNPSTAALRAAFRLLETAARSRGHDQVIDGWEPDVAWLRGGDGARPPGP